MPPSFSGSGTRSHSDSAWSKCRCASAGAASRQASSPARTEAANAPGMSWLARQCMASSAAEPVPAAPTAARPAGHAAGSARPAAGRCRSPRAAARAGTPARPCRRAPAAAGPPPPGRRPRSRPSASPMPASPGRRRSAGRLTAAARSTCCAAADKSTVRATQQVGQPGGQLAAGQRMWRAVPRRSRRCPRRAAITRSITAAPGSRRQLRQVLGHRHRVERPDLDRGHARQPLQLADDGPERVRCGAGRRCGS